MDPRANVSAPFNLDITSRKLIFPNGPMKELELIKNGLELFDLPKLEPSHFFAVCSISVKECSRPAIIFLTLLFLITDNVIAVVVV